MQTKQDEFLTAATSLINDLKDCIDNYSFTEREQINELETLAKTDKKQFVKQFKKLSGATNFDLPDIIYSES